MTALSFHTPSGWNGAAPLPSRAGFPEKPKAADCRQENPAMPSSITQPSILPRPERAISRLQRQELQFRILLVATYPFFLVAAGLQRLSPARSSAGPSIQARRRSVFGEAKAMAVSAIPFVFMG